VRAVQITRFGGPEVLDVVDLPDPVPADGQRLFDVSAAGVNYADTHHAPSREVRETAECAAPTFRSCSRSPDVRTTAG
jgi:NADPH:quinone reductase-like Zn-dependent oxidoreductase